jgi:hypothetical protein
MLDGLYAPVPRCLRVRGTIQVASYRVPARGFLAVASAGFAGMVAVILGADVERSVWAAGLLALAGLLAVEARLWGRPAHKAAAILARALGRPSRLRLGTQTIELPADTVSLVTAQARRPRWKVETDDAQP